MLRSLIEFTIQRRGLVICLAALAGIFGLLALWRLPFDAFPDTTPVMVQVNVASPGWAPEEVERQITYPLERVLAGLAGLSEVRSISKYGLAQVTLIFEDGVDIYRARQQVTERLPSVELPEGVPPPQLGPVSTGLGEIFHYVIVGRTADSTELRTLQDWIVKPQLQAIPGVAEVNSWGGFEKQYHVLVDPNRLVQYHLGLSQVEDVLRSSLGNVPGGQMVRGGEQTIVVGVGQLTRREEIEQLVVATHDGVPIRIQDLAEVVVGHELRRGAVTYQGSGEVTLGLGFMLTGQNSQAVTERLSRRLEEVNATLPPGVEARPVYAARTWWIACCVRWNIICWSAQFWLSRCCSPFWATCGPG